jgi:copper transport protein
VTVDGYSVLYAAARWLGYLAAFLVIGAVGFRRFVLPRCVVAEVYHPLGRKAAAQAGGAAVLLVVAHLARLYLQARSLVDPSEPVTVGFIGDIFTTGWGRGWLAQVAAAVLAAVGARIRSASGDKVLGVAALGIVLAAPLTGHAVGLPQAGWLGYPLDLLHFGLGGLWLGTLATMLIVGLRGELVGVIPVARLVTAFSTVALVAGVGAIACGVVIAWRYLGALAPFVTSTYGRTVLIKAAALAGVAGIGAYNWRVIGPRLARDQPAPVRQSSTAEIAIGVVLLAITAVLVALPLPGEE